MDFTRLSGGEGWWWWGDEEELVAKGFEYAWIAIYQSRYNY